VPAARSGSRLQRRRLRDFGLAFGFSLDFAFAAGFALIFALIFAFGLAAALVLAFGFALALGLAFAFAFALGFGAAFVFGFAFALGAGAASPATCAAKKAMARARACLADAASKLPRSSQLKPWPAG
jgi:hypothetical protein